MKKTIHHDYEAISKLKAGIDMAADSVKITLGASGLNAIIGREFEKPLITNDGRTIVDHIALDDETEQLGVDAVKDALKSADDRAGDGTTTTTVLLQKIFDIAYSKLSSGSELIKTPSDPMKIRREINDACKEVVAKLREKAVPVTSVEDISKVAFVSVEDKALGDKIGQMFHELGTDSNVIVEDGISNEVEFEIMRGTKIACGFHSPHFANEKGEYSSTKPYILITDQPINYPEQIQPIITKAAAQKRKEMIIIAEDFSREMIKVFTINHANGIFSVLAVKAPVYHSREKLEDYAILTGATVIDETIKETNIEHLGTCDKVIIDKDSTLLLGCPGDTKARIESLKEQKDKATSKFDQESYQKRINLLSGGVGVVRVGAQSESEREYLKLKIEDAVNATKWAMDGGVVRGGGIALKEIADELPTNILTEAIKAPYNQIMKNTGGDEISPDIIDPVKITITALEKACSVAGMLITTGVTIAIKKDEEKSNRFAS